MKKLLGISIVAVLAVSPMVASAADPTTPIVPVATNDTTVGVASTKYVKEAYNAMAGAVNGELAKKQDTMSAGKGISITGNKISVDAGSGLDFDGDTDSAKLVVSGLTNAHIASGAAIDQSKISGLTDALSNKQATLTDAQLAAVNSGITSTKVGGYDTHITNGDIHVTAEQKAEWSAKQDALSGSNSITIDETTDTVSLKTVEANSGFTIGTNGVQVTAGTANIVDSAVTTAKIADLNVTTDKLAANAVTTVKINNGAVITDKLADNAVTTAKIKDSNVTTAKIADLNVTTDKLAASAVTTAKIADSNVTTAKIADSNVTTAKIADSNVTTAKIADGAVTADKLGAEIQLYSGWNSGGAPTPNATTVALVNPVSAS